MSYKVIAIFPNRRILHIVGVAFSRFGQRLEIEELSLDIKTKVKTFDSCVLISRLESRLLKSES